MTAHAVLLTVTDRPGMLFNLTGVLASHHANITYVDMHSGGSLSDIYFEFTIADGTDSDSVLRGLKDVEGVVRVEETPSLVKIYGKRIIVMGGGAQVGQVALGAIAEADRHNIRGERISVDTIPLVGEMELAAAVRAVVRLPRVRLLVLAGSLMNTPRAPKPARDESHHASGISQIQNTKRLMTVGVQVSPAPLNACVRTMPAA